MNTRNLNNVIQNVSYLNRTVGQLNSLIQVLMYDVEILKKKLAKIVPDDEESTSTTSTTSTKVAPQQRKKQNLNLQKLSKIPVL